MNLEGMTRLNVDMG